MVRLEGLGELDHVGVLQFLHEHNFTTDAIPSMFVRKFRFIVDLRSVVFTLTFLVRQADHGVRTFAQLSTELVVFVDLVRGSMRGRGRAGGFFLGFARLCHFSQDRDCLDGCRSRTFELIVIHSSCKVLF